MKNDVPLIPEHDAPKGAALVVDDEEAVGRSIGHILIHLGYTVTLATDPGEALALFDRNKFLFVITDYTMPGMNGLEFAARIKEKSPEQCVIMVSGSPVNYSMSGTLPNIDSFVFKPFSIQELQAAIDRCPSAATECNCG